MSKLEHLSKMFKVHFISCVCVCQLSIHDFFLLFINFSLCPLNFLKSSLHVRVIGPLFVTYVRNIFSQAVGCLFPSLMPHLGACGISVPWPGMNSSPLRWKQSSNQRTAKGFPVVFFNIHVFIWLHWLLAAARRISDLCCGMQDLSVVACKLFTSCMWDLVCWPGIELWSPALGVWSLCHWTTREVPFLAVF